MKKYWLLALVCGQALAALGQKIVQENLPLAAGERLTLNLRFADSIRVSSWDKDEVSIRAVVVVNNNQLNDAFLLSSKRSEGLLAVESNFDKEKIKQGRASNCPGQEHQWGDGSYTVNKDGSTWQKGGYSVCSNIYFEVKVPRRAETKLETISGNIEIVQWEGSLQAKSISGFVDLSWPAGRGADLSLKTISGEVFSNLDLELGGPGKKTAVGYSLQGTVAGGGQPIRLESISGNIYLRRQ
jgi:hypothetical protein